MNTPPRLFAWDCVCLSISSPSVNVPTTSVTDPGLWETVTGPSKRTVNVHETVNSEDSEVSETQCVTETGKEYSEGPKGSRLPWGVSLLLGLRPPVPRTPSWASDFSHPRNRRTFGPNPAGDVPLGSYLPPPPLHSSPRGVEGPAVVGPGKWRLCGIRGTVGPQTSVRWLDPVYLRSLSVDGVNRFCFPQLHPTWFVVSSL